MKTNKTKLPLNRRLLFTAGTVIALSAVSRPADGQGARQSKPDTSQASVFDEVRKVLARELDVEPNKISMSSNIIKDLGADSLDKTEMIMLLEEHYGVSMDCDAEDKIETVGDAVKAVQDKLRTGGK